MVGSINCIYLNVTFLKISVIVVLHISETPCIPIDVSQHMKIFQLDMARLPSLVELFTVANLEFFFSVRSGSLGKLNSYH